MTPARPEADRVEFQLPEGRPRNEEELRLYVGLAAGVVIPDRAVCPNHYSPWRAFCEAYYAEHPVMVLKGSRALAGKSFWLATLSWVEATTLGCGVNVLGGSGDQSENVLRYHTRFWSRRAAPHHLLASDPSKRETVLTNGGRIAALTASQKSVRHGHPDRLRLDEADEMERKILDAALGQTLEREGGVAEQTMISSTHQYLDGTMTYVLKEARDRGWPVREWCYRETMAQPRGWLTEAALRKSQHRVPAAMWRVEYDLQEPGTEGRAFEPDAVEAMFEGEEFEDANGHELVFEPPVPGAWYGTGADWAKTTDWTLVETLRADVSPMRLVAYLRIGRVPYPAIVPRFDSRCSRYPGGAAHDGTGVGVAVGDYLTAEAEDVTMQGKARTTLLAEYIAAVEHGRIRAPRVSWMYLEHKRCTWNDLFGTGHAPDSVVAGALAYRAAQNAASGLVLPLEAETKKSTWGRG